MTRRSRMLRLAVLPVALVALLATTSPAVAASQPRTSSTSVVPAASELLAEGRTALAAATAATALVDVEGLDATALPAIRLGELQVALAAVQAQSQTPAPVTAATADLAQASSAQVRSDTAALRAATVTALEERAAAEAAAVAAAEAKAAEEAAIAAAAVAEALAESNTPDGAKATARAMAADQYGWGEGEFSCLASLWERESGWNYQAYNAGSGATGIPQSLPGDKMASAGADWQTNAATQIAWGLGYISDVYGSPCGAWGHSQATGWY